MDKQTEPGPNQIPTSLQVFFGEEATPDDPDLLDLLKEMQVTRLTAGSDPVVVNVGRDADSLSVKLSGDQDEHLNALYVATHDLGVRDKGGEAFRLVYYAKAGPPADAAAWSNVLTKQSLALDVLPTVAGGQIELVASFNGSPAAVAEVKAMGPGMETFTGETNADGKVSFAIKQAGRYSIRVRHVETASGKVGDKAYDTVRHYATLTLDVPPSLIPISVDTAFMLPELPFTLTSFGGAMLGDVAYVYGGTKGSAHDYYKGIQSGALIRLPIALTSDTSTAKWETISEGPELQGLAMVPHGGKLYRIGGFEARNAQGEDDSLWSVNTVACFDPQTVQWTDIAPLPEPRSSFDAAVIGDTIYVVGGWSMQGEEHRVWHVSGWQLDLSQSAPSWQPIAAAPFERRALAVAAHQGKLYAIGGITSGGETVRETNVYDPVTDKWSAGPELVGTDGMTGFGAAAFATGGELYVSSVTGSLQRLSHDGSEWNVVGQTPTARFFHRMLPLDDQRFVVIGGSSMRVGKIKATEVFAVP